MLLVSSRCILGSRCRGFIDDNNQRERGEKLKAEENQSPIDSRLWRPQILLRRNTYKNFIFKGLWCILYVNWSKLDATLVGFEQPKPNSSEKRSHLESSLSITCAPFTTLVVFDVSTHSWVLQSFHFRWQLQEQELCGKAFS